MIRFGWVVGAALAVVLGCAGCAPATPAGPAPVPATPTPTGITLPPRPAELRLDGVDPCAILSPRQRAELGLDGGLVPYESNTSLFGRVPACSIRGFEPRAIAVDLAVVTGKGIEAITEGGVTDELIVITVGGFPAVLARPRNPDFCAVDIDVAPGQLLEVGFADGGRKPQIPQDQLCRDAQAVAAAAVTSLLAR